MKNENAVGCNNKMCVYDLYDDLLQFKRIEEVNSNCQRRSFVFCFCVENIFVGKEFLFCASLLLIWGKRC